jgi:hypothetical protein
MNQLVEIRTWPQCTDVHVIDVQGVREIAHYPLDPDLAGPAFDPRAPFAERAQQIINFLEADQDFLEQTFQVSDPVTLEIDPRPRELIAEVLTKHGLSFEQLDLGQTAALVEVLDQRSDQELFALLVDWFDVVESHKHLGYSAQHQAPWITRSEPGSGVLFHYLALEQESTDEADSGAHKAAYALFTELIDANLADYNFGRLLRWIYYHRTEFPNFSRPEMTAWAEIKEQS